MGLFLIHSDLVSSHLIARLTISNKKFEKFTSRQRMQHSKRTDKLESKTFSVFSKVLHELIS